LLRNSSDISAISSNLRKFSVGPNKQQHIINIPNNEFYVLYSILPFAAVTGRLRLKGKTQEVGDLSNLVRIMKSDLTIRRSLSLCGKVID